MLGGGDEGVLLCGKGEFGGSFEYVYILHFRVFLCLYSENSEQLFSAVDDVVDWKFVVKVLKKKIFDIFVVLEYTS